MLVDVYCVVVCVKVYVDLLCGVDVVVELVVVWVDV